MALAGPKGARSLRDFGNAARVVGSRFAGRPILLLPVEKRYDQWAARICLELETLTGVRVEHAPDAAVALQGRGPALGHPGDPVVIALSPAVESQRKLEDAGAHTQP